uniref:JmjC domain-containing protein n=1 Tax=Haptolina ericina TaxID=156174 RepID=A0A7S3BAN4_9EUKA
MGLESTVWNEAKQGGSLGAFTTHGFAPPVAAQLALELERALPRIFSNHTLKQFWGFKHDTLRAKTGISAHVDFAAINVNFWVTPDVANLNQDSSGIVVYKRWAGHDATTLSALNAYGVDAKTLGLGPRDVKLRVGYQQNRAVLFNSGLFHSTDTINFKPGFENCRINYTLLYGFLESIICPNVERSDASCQAKEGQGQSS